MEVYIKIDDERILINELLYVTNPIWGDITAYEIKLHTTLDNMKELLHDNMEWSVIRRTSQTRYTPEGEPEIIYHEDEEDCSNLSVADHYRDYTDGTVSVVMREQTSLEEAYELLYGGE